MLLPLTVLITLQPEVRQLLLLLLGLAIQREFRAPLNGVSCIFWSRVGAPYPRKTTLVTSKPMPWARLVSWR